MYNCIVLSNDILTKNTIEAYINESEEMTLNAIFSDSGEVLTFLKKHPIDLLFIDIDETESTFELLNNIEETIKLVFISSNPSFALNAFKFLTIDYLLKPISEARFIKTIEKVKYMTFSLDINERVSELSFHKILMIQSGQKKWKVPSQSIILIESIGEYVKVYCTNQLIVSLGALRDFMTTFPEKSLFGFINRMWFL